MALTAEDRLVLIRAKIERAKKHLIELEAEAAKFRDADSNVIGPQKNPETGDRTINHMHPVSVPLASFNILTTAGDVIQNLRSALDHLAYQLVLVAGVEPLKVSTNIGFPIFGSAEIYESAKIRKVQGMRPEAVKSIDSLKTL